MYSLKRGYTLLEAVIVIGIISILSLGIGVGYGNFRERLELEEAKIIIIGTMGKYRDMAYYTNKSYSFLIDTNGKYIEIWEDKSHIEKKRFYLPKNLRYQVPTTNMGSIVTRITPNGNFADAFSLYIFGKNQKARYRLGFYSFLQLKYFKINLYRNVGAEGAVYGNIRNYHDTTAAKNLVGWEMVR